MIERRRVDKRQGSSPFKLWLFRSARTHFTSQNTPQTESGHGRMIINKKKVEGCV